MNHFKCWQRTYNAAVTGLTSQPHSQQNDNKQFGEAIAAQAAAIADRAVQYHIQFAKKVNDEQSELALHLTEQEKAPLPYAHKSNR